MNRAGLAVVLAIAVAVGVAFGIYPQLDLDIAAWFFDSERHWFIFDEQPWQQPARDTARWLITALAAPAAFAILGKLIMPNRRMLISGRATVFIAVTLALAPGVLAHSILKEHWGRSRPIDVTEFGGTDRFTAWWDPRGRCPSNCSFVAGEPSAAFWTLAPAALAPPQWRPLAYAAALAFGVTVGVMRVASGSHFFSDVVFAGVLMFLVIWIFHGLIYRWQRTRLTDAAIEQPLRRAGEGLRSGLTALGRLIGLPPADKRS